MVAVRNAHLNINGEFDLDAWINGLDVKQKTAQQLREAYELCRTLTKGDKDRLVLLWRGREMVEILTTLSMDQHTLLSALLFPLYDADLISPLWVTENYTQDILKLLEGVQQMAAIRQLNAAQEGSAASEQVDSVRRMLLSMVDDFRCVIIKLAERICFLREVKNEAEDVKQGVAKECANIYAPLANRLGIGQLKWEIEDYTFRYQHPDIYKQIAHQLAERRIDRERYINDFVANLSSLMKKMDIKAEVYGRPKHIYSIWRKMQKKSLAFDELFDVRAVRVITNELQDCYAALGVVHTNFKHLPDEFDDYVANPKPNGYQSIHTVVLGPQGKAIEIQIRTHQMHDDAELGVAAHWKYKEGTTGSQTAYDEKINWLRKLISWQEEMADSGEMMDELRSQVFDDRVYAFTPSGDVIDLPMGATPLDFAYHIHSEVGHRCIGAKVAGRIVPYTYKLKMGDQVEIITQKEPNPSRDWLNPSLGFISTSRARAKINTWFRKQDRDKNIQAGKEILEIEIAKINATMRDVEKYCLEKFNAHHLEDMFAGVGTGDLRINQIVNYLNAIVNKESIEDEEKRLLKELQESEKKTAPESNNKSTKDAVVVEGLDNLMTHIARCCQPIPGDPIVGYVTQGRGISVHRADCEQLNELRHHAADRIIDAVWGYGFEGNYSVTLRVVANERSGLIKEITSLMANEKIKVNSMNSKVDFKKGVSILDFNLELPNVEVLARVTKRLEDTREVVEVSRVY